jgi:hypothetical protein
MLQVRFVNRGWGTDDGVKEVAVQSLKIDHAGRPYAIVDNPFFPGDSLRANYESDEWVCDLD